MLAALAAWQGLSSQLKDQELARVRLDGGEVLTATAGAGWFGVETSSKHCWLWSDGAGSFVLDRESAGGRQEAKFGFKFGLRSLDRRPVKILLGDEVVWEGVSELRLQYFDVSGLKVPAASAELRFVSYAPGVPEADSPDARRLAFAIYNFALKP